MSEKAKNVILKIVIPCVLTVAVVVLAFWGARQSALAEDYKNASGSMYRRAFSELCTVMDDMQTALGKLRVAASGAQRVLLLDDIWRLSGSGSSLIGQIPASHVDTAELESFITRVGDYAHSLTKKALAGEASSEDDDKQLVSLYTRCGELARELEDRQSVGDVPVEILTSDAYFEEADDTYRSSEDVDKFPTLIYDGPFSESTEKQEPKGVTGSEVTEDEAAETALAVTGATSCVKLGASDGTIPAWEFRATLADGREAEVSITKTGGRLLYFMGSASGDAAGVPDDKTVQRLRAAGLEWLEKHDFGDMEPTYAQYYGGAALINFAAVQDDAIIYNDLVKVWVDAETFEVIGADAKNYLFSHTKRDIQPPAVSSEEAEARVSVGLDIESVRLALIPLTPQTETLCYEFTGKCSGDTYIVYIDAQTGAEQQIFVVISDENGELTM